MKMDKISNRIWLKDNPWPEGHGLKDVRFYGVLSEEGVFLHLEIASEDYYAKEGYDKCSDIAEKHDEALEEQGEEDDWKYYSGWLNFNACHIRPNIYPILGNEQNPFSMKELSDLELIMDDPPPKEDSWGGIDFDNLAFHCYVLGHDAVGHHHIKIISAGEIPLRYDIDWEGKIALAYEGDNEFRYSFKVQLRNIPFDGFDGRSRDEFRYGNKMEEKEGFWYDTRKDRTMEEREKELRDWIERYTDIGRQELKFISGEYSDWLKFY